jgi:hypothetical protein
VYAVVEHDTVQQLVLRGKGKCHATKAYGSVYVNIYTFLNSALDGCEWSCFDHFTLGKEFLLDRRSRQLESHGREEKSTNTLSRI